MTRQNKYRKSRCSAKKFKAEVDAIKTQNVKKAASEHGAHADFGAPMKEQRNKRAA